jgi:arsenate reductase (glutaredoxin)
MTDKADLQGLRVLVVEDEMMVSMLIEDMLGDLGCTVVGPAARLDEAMALARDSEIDCAVLDVNLGGQPIFPLADLLREKGAPFAELGLGDPVLTDDQLLDAIEAHPILLNRPIVVSPLGVKLCRPSEAVLDLLPSEGLKPFTKEDGEVVIDTEGRRAR